MSKHDTLVIIGDALKKGRERCLKKDRPLFDQAVSAHAHLVQESRNGFRQLIRNFREKGVIK